MHMRTKKWARPELAACPFYINHNGTEVIRGTWRERFAHPERPLHMEMGCGKGVSTARMIADNPEVNYIVSDMSPDVLGTARRNIEEACGGEPDNVMILRTDICFIHRVFGPEDAAERIYIHFCNPWTEAREAAADPSAAADAVPGVPEARGRDLVQDGRRHAVRGVPGVLRPVRL